MGFDYFQNALNSELQQLLNLKKEIDSIGDGHLHIRKNEGRTYFREYKNGYQKGITKDKKRIYQLARKDIIEERIVMTNKRITVINMAIKKLNCINAESQIDRIAKRYAMLNSKKILFSANELKIYNNRFSQNPFNKENLIYKTGDDVAMRSKSERFIGSFLENEGLLYMYEPEMIIAGKNVYPDFVVFRPDGKKVIWEHCGLMNDAEYYSKMVKRLEGYRRIGYVQHKNLICTYEEDLQNIETLENIVQRFIYT